MSPLYEYLCPTCKHRRTELRPVEERHDFTGCDRCLSDMTLAMSIPAKRTDGIYSYAPNIGTEEAFERKEAKIRDGQ